jgi:hypothetical protein
MQLPNIENHVLVGDFVDKLCTSWGTIFMQAPTPVTVGLFTDCIGGRRAGSASTRR